MPPCEGWSNEETWSVNLTINNDYKLYEKLHTLFEAVARRDTHRRFDGSVAARGALNRQEVESFARRALPSGAPVMPDGRKGFSRVNWTELTADWQVQYNEWSKYIRVA